MNKQRSDIMLVPMPGTITELIAKLKRSGLAYRKIAVIQLLPDPGGAPTRDRLPGADAELLLLDKMLAAWGALFKDGYCTAGRALALAGGRTSQAAVALDVALREVCKVRGVPVSASSATRASRISRWIRKHVGIAVNGRYFERVGSLRHASLWSVRMPL